MNKQIASWREILAPLARTQRAMSAAGTYAPAFGEKFVRKIDQVVAEMDKALAKPKG